MVNLPHEFSIGVKVMSDQKAKLDLRAVPPSIEERNGRYYVTQSPIALEAVILRFKEGLSPETIHRDCFPSIPLAQVYAVVSFYLNNQQKVQDYLEQARREEDDLQQQMLAAHPEFLKTADESRRHL